MRSRFIAYGLAVMLALVFVTLGSMLLIVEPGVSRLRQGVARLAVEHVLSTTVEAERQARLDALVGEAGLDVTIFDEAGAPLRTNVSPPLSLDGRDPVTMRFEHAGLRAAVRPREPRGPATVVAFVLGSMVLALVLLSIPVSRALTRRLEALSDAARRFGEGALDERVPVEGRDEVAETARAFNAMADRVAATRRTERELLANVSHELRTPMARMRVLLELIETNPARAQGYVGELSRDLGELDTLLERIIDATRLELAASRAGDPYPLRLEAVELSALLQDLATDFRARFPERPLEVRADTRREVRFDRTLVRRAVMNLLENAAKHSPASTPIRLELEGDGSIAVSDRGEGIDPADLPRVFDAFFRSDRSRARATGGVGLGLAFVQRVAQLHGGRAEAVSAPGRGSTFRLRLPA